MLVWCLRCSVMWCLRYSVIVCSLGVDQGCIEGVGVLPHQSAGQIISQTYQRIASEATRGAARAAIAAMKNHVAALQI